MRHLGVVGLLILEPLVLLASHPNPLMCGITPSIWDKTTWLEECWGASGVNHNWCIRSFSCGTQRSTVHSGIQALNFHKNHTPYPLSAPLALITLFVCRWLKLESAKPWKAELFHLKVEFLISAQWASFSNFYVFNRRISLLYKPSLNTHKDLIWPACWFHWNT